MPVQICTNRVNECLPCNDSPIENLSAEGPDEPLFIGWQSNRRPIRIGELFSALGCQGWVYASTQEEADALALVECPDTPVTDLPDDPVVDDDPIMGGGDDCPGPWTLFDAGHSPDNVISNSECVVEFDLANKIGCIDIEFDFECQSQRAQLGGYITLGPFPHDRLIRIGGSGYGYSQPQSSLASVTIGLATTAPTSSGSGCDLETVTPPVPILEMAHTVPIGYNTPWALGMASYLVPAGQTVYGYFLAFSSSFPFQEGGPCASDMQSRINGRIAVAL